MYLPQSQIKSNLYTNGEEFCLKSDNSPYTGYYYKLSSGKAFTGKTPQDGPNNELISISPINPPGSDAITQTIGYENNSGEFIAYPYDFDMVEYPLFEEKQLLREVPKYSPNIPSKDDYKIGEFIRYFCKRTNMLYYLEISKDMYDKLLKKDPTVAYQFYQPFSVPWQLTGNKENVYKTNRNIVKLTMKEKKLYSFDLYLKKDYTQYYLEN